MSSFIGLGIYLVWIAIVSVVHVWYLKTRCNYDSNIPYDPTQIDRLTAKSRRATWVCAVTIWSGLVVFLIWNYN